MQRSVLILDLDGTVVPMVKLFHGRPSPLVKKSLKMLISRGVHVSIATGRPLKNALPMLKELGIVDPCVISDGAIIYNPADHTFIDTNFLDPERTEKIFNTLGSLVKYLYVHTLEGEEHFGPHIRGKYLTGMWFIGGSKKEHDKAFKLLSADPSLGLRENSRTWEGLAMFSIADIHSTKQIAVSHLMEYFNVKAEQIVAVGDSENDTPMILAAGIGVAMGNAPEGLKSIAEYVAPSVDQDGVVDVIEKFFPSK